MKQGIIFAVIGGTLGVGLGFLMGAFGST